eukprot:scaffold34983_cov69-Cyclotella_meneghiniana.AAC.1
MTSSPHQPQKPYSLSAGILANTYGKLMVVFIAYKFILWTKRDSDYMLASSIASNSPTAIELCVTYPDRNKFDPPRFSVMSSIVWGRCHIVRGHARAIPLCFRPTRAEIFLSALNLHQCYFE